MKTYTYLLIAVYCMMLSGCGMTEPWKEWENEGIGEDRLKPADLREFLCEADGWKLNYQNMAFYFTFSEDDSATSETDEHILKGEVVSTYRLYYQGAKTLVLKLDNSGALQYLDEGVENIIYVTEYSADRIVGVGEKNGKEMIFTPVTKEQLKQVAIAKEKALIEYNKKQSLLLFQTELKTGVLADVSDNAKDFLAYYFISCDGDNWKITVSTIKDKVLSHTEYPVTVDISGDEKAALKIDGLTLGETDLEAIYFNYAEGSISVANENIDIEVTDNTQFVKDFNDSWKGGKADMEDICEEFSSLISKVEFDGRTPKNIVIHPGKNPDNTSEKWHYVCYSLNMTADAATGIIHLENTDIKPLNSWYKGPDKDPNDGTYATQFHKIFLDFCFSPEGLYMFKCGDYTYVISPTGAEWFKMK